MNKLLVRLNNFEEYVLAVLMPLMCVVIFISTFFRFTKLMVIPWAEELARYTMIWILFFGISAAAKRGEHFCVTVFVSLLPQKIQKIIIVVRMILMAGFSLFVTRFCIFIIQSQIRMGQISPSLGWPMWTMYSAVFVGCCLMLIRYVGHGIQELRSDSAR
ncbi:MAG: TRAP transporter small permease [Treponema sp.]|nr:TRAP transporter small permease [Treponema sp.]